MSMRVSSGEQVYGCAEQMSLEVQAQMGQGKSQSQAIRSVCMTWKAQISRSLVATESDKRAVERGVEGMSMQARTALIRTYDVLLRQFRSDMQQVRAYEQSALRVVARSVD